MDGKQHFTPTSGNGIQPGEKQVSHDLKGTGGRTHDNVRIIGQSKDDIQIREGRNLNILNNSASGKSSDVAEKSQEKAIPGKTSLTEVKTTEGQVGPKDTMEKPSTSGAQIVLSHTAMESNSASNQGTGPAPLHTELLSNDANSILQRSVSVDGETQLNQAAIKLLQRLEFKNPGRKQIEYGTFNPESSEREKKKLRRFQNSKPRTGACYKEDGILLDGRDLCDCLTESCPGCFYPCPQCGSQKCGPTCRCNRRWVYDYIEDEARTYKVEFPEAENFGT